MQSQTTAASLSRQPQHLDPGTGQQRFQHAVHLRRADLLHATVEQQHPAAPFALARRITA
jgi:hypothetical protein